MLLHQYFDTTTFTDVLRSMKMLRERLASRNHVFMHLIILLLSVCAAGEGKERFRQRLWCYLFENMNRAIDELYFLCELESDVEQIKEALLVLDEAGLDFKDLKARVEGFDRVNKGPGLPRPASAASTSSSVSSKGDPQQRRPHAIAWEVRFTVEVASEWVQSI